VRIGVDTSVLVATMHANHPLHAVAASWVVAGVESDELIVCHHSVLECYAVLTRLPRGWRTTGDEARRLIDETVRRNMTLADFDPTWVWGCVDWMADSRTVGGRSYDAFVADVLRRAEIEAIATFNISHFSGLVPGLRLIDPGQAASSHRQS
jgi:predicted nucleic acid-binding protein